MASTNVLDPSTTTLDYACKHLDLPAVDRQQERYLLSRFRGLSPAASARASGMSTMSGKAFEATDHFQSLLSYLHEHAAEACGITREKLTVMLLDAHDVSATAGERVSAIRELGQLHDLYPSKQAQVNVQVNNTTNITNEKQIGNLSDTELLTLADAEALEPVRND